MMRWLRYMRLEMPLLGKDLVELAAQPRTYVIRVACAVALYAFFLWRYIRGEMAVFATMPEQVMGLGRDMFQFLLMSQLVGIYVFLPVTAATAITREKEQGTLDLLLVSGMNPWMLVVQKHVASLIVAGSLLLVSMPLMAVAYAMGGVDQAAFIRGELGVFLVACLYGAVGIAVSAHATSTIGSLLRTYVFGFLFLFCFGDLFSIAGSTPIRGSNIFAIPLVSTVVVLVLTFAILKMATGFLIKRAHLPLKSSWSRKVEHVLNFGREFSSVTRTLARVDNARSDHRVLVKRGVTLKPVYLENKRALWWYLWMEMNVPVVAGLAVILLFGIGVVSLFLGLYDEPKPSPFHAFVIGTSIVISLLWVTVIGSQIVPGERASATLGVLLTTPLSGSEILAYKMREWWRMVAMLWGFIVCLCLMEAWVEHPFNEWRGWRDAALYLAGSIGVVTSVMMTATWFTMGIGMQYKSRLKALMISLVALGAWALVPNAILETQMLLSLPPFWSWATGCVSPYIALGAIEMNPANVTLWQFVSMALVSHAAILYFVRRHVLRNADRWLGRVSAPGTSAGEANT